MSWNGDQNLQYRPPHQVQKSLIQSRGFLQIPRFRIATQEQRITLIYNKDYALSIPNYGIQLLFDISHP